MFCEWSWGGELQVRAQAKHRLEWAFYDDTPRKCLRQCELQTPPCMQGMFSCGQQILCQGSEMVPPPLRRPFRMKWSLMRPQEENTHLYLSASHVSAGRGSREENVLSLGGNEFHSEQTSNTLMLYKHETKSPHCTVHPRAVCWVLKLLESKSKACFRFSKTHWETNMY